MVLCVSKPQLPSKLAMREVPDGAQVSCFPPVYTLGSCGALQNRKLLMYLWENMGIMWPWVTK